MLSQSKEDIGETTAAKKSQSYAVANMDLNNAGQSGFYKNQLEEFRKAKDIAILERIWQKKQADVEAEYQERLKENTKESIDQAHHLTIVRELERKAYEIVKKEIEPEDIKPKKSNELFGPPAPKPENIKPKKSNELFGPPAPKPEDIKPKEPEKPKEPVAHTKARSKIAWWSTSCCSKGKTKG